jgi:NAD-dependent SIR2 family protein deacetylase
MIAKLRGLDYKLGRIWGQKKFCRGVPLVKLHGSLNWLWCPKCRKVYVEDGPVAARYKRESCTARCGGMLQPLIIPPNAQKGEYLKTISGLWRQARSILLSADRIVIVGYSLPDVDTSAEQLLMEPVQHVKRFDVINSHPAALHAVEGKLRRKSDTPVATPFRDYVKAITT